MDLITDTARNLGTTEVVVLSADDFARVHAILWRMGQDDLLTEEERFSLSLVEMIDVTCPAAF